MTFKLSLAARVRFTVVRLLTGRRARAVGASKRQENRKARKCARTVTLRAGFAIMARAGARRFHFSGRIGGSRLAFGRYRLIATPSTGPFTGRRATASFRIVR